MISFDQPRMGKVITTGISIATATAMIAILPACNPNANSPSNISGSTPSPASSPVSSSTPSPVSSSTFSPSPSAIASPAPIANSSVPASPSPASSPSSNSDTVIDYGGKTSREYWIVTDIDPKGLNCRWSPAMPKDWANPSAKFPRLNIQEWQVVRQFSSGAELKANSSPAGFITIADENGKPWLKVSIGDNDQICLVRANSQFVQPR